MQTFSQQCHFHFKTFDLYSVASGISQASTAKFQFQGCLGNEFHPKSCWEEFEIKSTSFGFDDVVRLKVQRCR